MKSKVFNTEMVQAILKGDKTQFREIVKPQPKLFYVNGQQRDIINPNHIEFKIMDNGGHNYFMVPPYQAGDIIFVKETWKVCRSYDTELGFDVNYKSDNKILPCIFDVERYLLFGKFENKYSFQSPITMPEEAARIFLKIKDIKVQRLCSITEQQIKDEAIPYDEEIYNMPCNIENAGETYLKGCFMRMWDSKYEKKSYGWDKNPWVWCVEFERVEKPIHEEK